ncbi:hypothetical protein TWF694_006190 [Orbilia ellipsospora]|uniref:Acetylxylan esterase n=1 Tax=Orbilia ellipsospora TaxID=2528407 RepID=A0AAV9WSM1_9PEZI
MKPSTLLTALFATTATAASNSSSMVTDCATGLYMIVARGSGEDPGTGRIGIVANNVTERIKGSQVVALDYPANFTAYLSSESIGVTAMRLAIEGYVGKCPDSKYALLGWSQGAQVSLDTVCGTSDGQLFNKTNPISSDLTRNLVSIVGYGDPTHVPGLSWTLGTSKNKGLFPRQDTAACDPYASRIRTWCDTGDIYCDGGNNTAVHSSYFVNYTGAAVDFIVSQYNLMNTSSTGVSSTSSAGPTSSPTTPASPTTTSAKNSAAAMSSGTIGYIFAIVLATILYA